jgi:hypothetical protein
MSDKGWLQVSYLGTEAPKSTANVLVPNQKNQNYEQMDREH